MDSDRIKTGQVYRCKRRGHLLKIVSFTDTIIEGSYAFYRNSRGALVSVYIPRLLKPSRFTLISEIGPLSPAPQEATAGNQAFPEEQVAA